MLDKSIKENIESIDHGDLDSMYKKFLAEHGEQTSVDTFVTHLFNNKLITTSEFKHIQSEEMVDVSDISSEIEKLSTKTGVNDNEDTNEDFTIIESIDEGAMGEILIAKDNSLHRTVAYKKIHPHVAEMPSFLGRFYKEAQVTAQLQHPNIVPVYGLTFRDGAVGYVMKLIDGITLKQHLKETMDQYNDHGEPDEHHTLHARLEHFLKVCDAIHYAHRKGVVHRDLKPLNVMIGPYHEVYVMDWGIAKTIRVDQAVFGDQRTVMVGAETEEKDKTALGQVMGTPAYMSPEQAAGENDILDHRSDLYSLGLILHELVTFHRAINGKTSEELMMKARRGHIDPPPAYKKQADEQEQLLAIVKKATQYMPEDRYATVADFADDIRRFMHGEAIHARPESSKQKIMRWVQNNRKKAVNIMAYTILFCFASVSLFLLQQMRSMQSTHNEEAIVNELSNVVTETAQSIDRQFLKYEGILEGLATGATNLFNQGSEDPEPYYTNLSIDDSYGGAPDYTFSDLYGFPISIDWHVYKLAPGVSEQNVEPLLRKLNPLRHSFKSLLIKSYKEDISPNDDKAIRNAILVEGLPLVWAHIGLENGVLADYPGKTGYPASYDPRQRPWYRATLNNTGANWLQPYVDVGGRGLVLPCTSPLYDTNGNFIGVAAVEVTVDYVRKEMMNLEGVDGLEETYLLNENGEVIVRSSDKNQSFGVGTMINKVEELDLFDNEYIVNKITKQASRGEYFFIEKGREKALAYHALGSTGWYFVAKIDAEELRNRQ